MLLRENNQTNSFANLMCGKADKVRFNLRSQIPFMNVFSSFEIMVFCYIKKSGSHYLCFYKPLAFFHNRKRFDLV